MDNRNGAIVSQSAASQPGRSEPGAGPGSAGAPFRWPGRLTTRLTAVVLGSQAPVVLFAASGARALAASENDPSAGSHLLLGIGVMALCIVAAALTRWRIGILLGWLAQLATFAYALVVPMMVVVGLIFGGLWVVSVVQGRKMDALTAARAAAGGLPATD